MSREKQIIEDFIQRFVSEKGTIPNENELSKFLSTTLPYAPLTKPMVPLANAISIAPYITDTLKSVLKDREHLNSLAEGLLAKTKRVESSSKLETQFIDSKVTSILNTQKDNSFKTIYNEVPELLDAGDVEDTFLWASSVADLYIIGDDAPTQSILLTAHNVKKGPEGISLVKSSEQLINATIETTLYSTSAGTTMRLLSDINPISAIITGTKGNKKGLSLALGISQKFVSEVELDINACTAEVIVDGEPLFTKTLDGPTILSIHKTITEKIVINFYGESSQVYINIKDILVIASGYSSTGTYGNGRYLAMDLHIDKSYGGLLFKPDEYIPTGTSINWEYSSDTLAWKQLEKDKQGSYLPLDWNKIDKEYTPSEVELDAADVKLVPAIPYAAPKNVKLSTGKGALMFTTKQLLGYYAFMGYLEAPVDTGYTLTLYNPLVDTSNRLFKRILIISDTFNYDESPGETIDISIPKGTHKLTIELFQDDSFNLDYTKNNDGDFDKRESYENIIKILRDEYLIDVTLEFKEDAQGRPVNLSIQPLSLTEVDRDLFDYLDEKSKINSFALDNDSFLWLTKLNNSSKYYDILLLDDTFSVDTPETITAEYRGYAGDGSTDFTITPYFTPTSINSVLDPKDITLTADTDYTFNQSVTLLSAALPDTTTASIEQFIHTGSDSMSSTDLLYAPKNNSIAVISYNYDPTGEVVVAEQQATGTSEFTVYEELEVWKEELLSDIYITLSRQPSNATIEIVWDQSASFDPATPFASQSVTWTEGFDLLVNNTGYEMGNRIWVKYNVTPTLTLSDDSTALTFNNLPKVDTLHRKIRQTVEISSEYLTATSTFYTIDAEAAAPMALPRLNEIIVTVTDSEGVGVDETSSISSVSGDTLVVDLSGYYDDMEVKNYTVTIEFYTQAINTELTFVYTYSYFATVYFKLNYEMIRKQTAKIEEIYSKPNMLQYFYDISYYITDEENEPDADPVRLHLMANLKGNKTASPIIRRLIFERQ